MSQETPGVDGRGFLLRQSMDRRAALKFLTGGLAAVTSRTVVDLPKVAADSAIETTGTPPKRVETSYLGRKLLIVRPETWTYNETLDDEGNKKILLTKADTTSIGEITLLGKVPLQYAITLEKDAIEKTWDTESKPSYYSDPDYKSFTSTDRKGFLNQYDMVEVYGFSLNKIADDIRFERRYLIQYPDTDGQHTAKLRLSQSQQFILANNQAMYTPCAYDRNDFFVTTVGNFQAL